MQKTTLTKTQLETLKTQLLKDEQHLSATMASLKAQDPFNDPDHANDNAAVDTDIREQVDHDTLEAEVKSLEKRQELILIALKKMDEGTYGMCEHSGEQISYERLCLVPEARYCTQHNSQLVK